PRSCAVVGGFLPCRPVTFLRTRPNPNPCPASFDQNSPKDNPVWSGLPYQGYIQRANQRLRRQTRHKVYVISCPAAFKYLFSPSESHLIQRNRSCRRNAPSAQNSISTGLIRYPPQCGGREGLRPRLIPSRATSAINVARLASGRL